MDVRKVALLAVAAVALSSAQAVAAPPPQTINAAAQAVAAAGTALSGYKIQSTGSTTDTAAAISQPGYAATGWYQVGPRSTVLAGLLANNAYPDPFFSTNMSGIPASRFSVPWWYRSEFTLADQPGNRTYLDFSGVISKADVYVNGAQVASSTQVAGAYNRQELDVTANVHSGVNAVAFKVYPNNPNSDLTMGWIDWLQPPPDKNMGIFRDVLVRRNGTVALRGAHVVTTLNNALTQATLVTKVEARNTSGSAVTATISGTVAGQSVSTSVSLAANETRTVTFGTITLNSPNVWWPAGQGGQPLYDADLAATVGGVQTDTAHERFGVRSVTAVLDASGHRSYKVNGRPALIKGGGWSNDVFLRWDPVFVEDKIRYALDLGLNTIRLEGHLEPDEFFEMTDRLGMLVIAGWECCDKWEGNNNGGEPGDTWTSADYPIAQASMTSEAVRMRNHPSVISFLIGSDFAPTGTVESTYVNALNAADWPTPVISAASAKSSPITGASGMKMNGPYDWVPPNYWYDKSHSDAGGAWGFASEISAGPSIPTMDTLKRMLTQSEINSLSSTSGTQYHRSPSSTFNNLGLFNNALNGRYGAPTSADDYVRKAQLQQYENVRAQFEAYARNFTDSSNPSTGVVYWMLNSGWTSLHWQLFDRYLDQNGAYFGAKKANEPLHIQYGYDTKAVTVVNSRHAAAGGLTATVSVYNTDGTQKFTQTVSNLSVAGDGARSAVLTLPAISGLSTTYLLKLTLSSGGAEVSRNVYWLSTAADTLNWSGTDWYYTPTSAYANLKGLSALAGATVATTAATVDNGDGTSTTSVTLRNTGSSIAFFVDAHVVGSGGAPILPIQWSDNEVTLWPGEQTVLTATYRTSGTPSVRVQGWNVPAQTVPGDGTQPPQGRLEAENATLVNASVATNHTGYSGAGFVDYANAVGSQVEWTYTAPAAGTVTATLAYANGTTVNRPMDLAVNGSTLATGVAFNGTGTWDTWVTKSFSFSVAAGVNKIRFTATTANGGPNVDYLDVSAGGTPPASVKYEAEGATVSQGVVEANHLNYSGTGFVNCDNVVGSYVEWTVASDTAGAVPVKIRFSNGTTTGRPADIIVNGVTVVSAQAFNSTGNWDTWADIPLTVNLNAGANSIRVVSTSANGPANLDYLLVG